MFLLRTYAKDSYVRAGSSCGLCSGRSRSLLNDDERHIRWSQEERVSRYHRNAGPAPITVATEGIEQSERLMTLDEAIRLTLQHSEVIRQPCTGVSAEFIAFHHLRYSNCNNRHRSGKSEFPTGIQGQQFIPSYRNPVLVEDPPMSMTRSIVRSRTGAMIRASN